MPKARERGRPTDRRDDSPSPAAARRPLPNAERWVRDCAVTYAKPLPLLEGATKEFYEWCRKRELRLQRCLDCGAWRHVPRAMCAACQSLEWEWARASGRGTLFTWCVVFDPPSQLFAADVPYAGVVVQLDEGPRLVTWISGVEPMALEAGMRLEVWFDDVTPEVTLPKFRPVS